MFLADQHRGTVTRCSSFCRTCCYLVPESKSIHLFIVVAKWCICKWLSVYVHIVQLRHISSYYLISIDKYHLCIQENTGVLTYVT
jgi:hypothetical protein